MGHDIVAALLANLEGGLKLFLKPKRVGVPVPEGTHHAAGQVNLDMVHCVLDLLPDGLHEAVGAVTLPGVTRSEEVTTGSGKEVPAGKHTGSVGLPRCKHIPPGHVHEVGGAAAADPQHPGLGHPMNQVAAKPGGLLGDG